MVVVIGTQTTARTPGPDRVEGSLSSLPSRRSFFEEPNERASEPDEDGWAANCTRQMASHRTHVRIESIAVRVDAWLTRFPLETVSWLRYSTRALTRNGAIGFSGFAIFGFRNGEFQSLAWQRRH
jgi:hypothetical protein